MASVSSLDQDMRKLRLDRYTPQAADEVRTWVEGVLGDRLASGDLLEALKDGVALCKLVNLIIPPPGIRFKVSTMPFTQRENISQFLRACELPPLSLPAHDRFLTVDLYDQKDPAQVIQCLSAFSRAANAVNPTRFPNAIGPKRAGPSSPARRNGSSLSENTALYGRDRGASNVSQNCESAFSTRASAARTLSPAVTGESNSSKTTDGSVRYSGGNVSSWSKRGDEYSTAPAWNIHQYGYMGGASQGNQGISFGARRQITSQGPQVPSLVEKEKKRKEQEAENERMRQHAQEADQRLRAEREADEEHERMGEERRWDEDSRKAKEAARQELEEQKRQWAEEERQWQTAEEERQREEAAAEEARKGAYSGLGLRNSLLDPVKESPRRVSESERIRELERQLEEAKERERQYQLEREARGGQQTPKEVPQPSQTPVEEVTPAPKDDPAPEDERAALREEWSKNQDTSPVAAAQPPAPFKRPLPVPRKPSSTVKSSFQKPPPETPAAAIPAPPPPTPAEPITTRPPPESSDSWSGASRHTRFASPPQPPTATPAPAQSSASPPARFTSSAPAPSTPTPHFAPELSMSSTSERATEDARRNASQARTKAGGVANKSLLEREMERERERQREWEEVQLAKRPMGPREMKR